MAHMRIIRGFGQTNLNEKHEFSAVEIKTFRRHWPSGM